MSVFIRRFTADPGLPILLNIESVNILDLNPPSAITGVGSGAVLLVGEFENGPFAAQAGATEVFSPQDALTTFGAVGFTYAGQQAQNPCARSRKADGALVPEYWNGSGAIQLSGKKFARLMLCRVDTSVGAVSLQRLAFLTGASAFRYALVTGQVLQLDVGAGPTSATFTGTAASVTAVGGTYPTTFAGGNTLVLGWDDPTLNPNITVTFLASDQSIDQVVARVNLAAGFAFADKTGGQLRLTGLVGGLSGQVRVVSGSTGVLAQLGLTSATTLGAGNVADIAHVTPTEVAVIVEAAIANTLVEVDGGGSLRISNTGASEFIVVGSGTTATALGFVAGAAATDNGEPILVSGAGTYALGSTGTVTFQLGKSLAQVTATVTATHNHATTVTDINAAFAAAGQGNPCFGDGATRLYFVGPTPGDTISVVGASSGAILTELGLTVGLTVGALPPMGKVPAGTVVQVPGGTAFVTMQDVDFEATGVSVGGVLQAPATSYSVKIRFALDDGTGVGTGAGTVTSIPSPPAIGAFTVVNPQVVANALSEGAVDAAYANAIAATVNPSSVAAQANIIYAARQSNAVRTALRTNALAASSGGCLGRMAFVRSPMNFPEQSVLSATSQQGVVGSRENASGRVAYCYPQANTFVPVIGAVGTAGGAGFTATGNVDVGADGFLASVCSQLNPEEDPGQLTSFLSNVNGLESGANVQGANGGTGFGIADYEAFKAAGICALRIDSGSAIFQSGVTTADPLLASNLTDINRRRMADFIQDSIAIAMKEFGKKLQTKKRRKAILGEIKAFLNGLAGGGPGASAGNPNNEDSQRIEQYATDDTQNSPDTTGLGLWRVVIAVRMLATFKSIVLQTIIGPTVVVTDISPAKAA